MRRTLLGSKERLGLEYVDLFQLHSGSECYGSLEDYADGLAVMVQEGHARCVGVSNVGARQVQRVHRRLKQAHGIQLFSNQVEFSLLEPGIATDGTLETCKHLGVKILAYCPLAMGRLTGKYSVENEPPFHGHGNKSYRYHGAVPWPHTESILAVCAEIAKRRNASVPQVALNWCIAHDTVPIPGAKTSIQALDNCKTLSWNLNDAELQKLDEVALRGSSMEQGVTKRSKGGGKGGSRRWTSKAV
jgi:pyridoxine 4-dehydrogenase